MQAEKDKSVFLDSDYGTIAYENRNPKKIEKGS